MTKPKRVLCYGDSNTWGFSPKDGHRMDERWTRLLAAKNPELEVLEEGLNSRNAVCKDAHMPEKCGFDSFKMMLMSHKPLDLIILMLGTNDLKVTYHCSAKYIAQGLREYIRTWMNPTLYEDTPRPQLLILAPILLGDGLPEKEGVSGNFDARSLEQSEHLAEEIRKICDEYPVAFFDASLYAKASELDSLHMDEANHQQLAEALSIKVRDLLSDSLPETVEN